MLKIFLKEMLCNIFESSRKYINCIPNLFNSFYEHKILVCLLIKKLNEEKHDHFEIYIEWSFFQFSTIHGLLEKS